MQFDAVECVHTPTIWRPSVHPIKTFRVHSITLSSVNHFTMKKKNNFLSSGLLRGVSWLKADVSGLPINGSD